MLLTLCSRSLQAFDSPTYPHLATLGIDGELVLAYSIRLLAFTFAITVTVSTTYMHDHTLWPLLQGLGMVGTVGWWCLVRVRV